VPCPLTTFMMTYAAGKGVIGSGLALSGAFATGMIVTVAAFPVAAVSLRGRVLEITAKLGKWRAQAAQLLETAAAVAIILLGVSSLARS
jgi:ABC-type nickel/cobalt efflux system permease component RcnA